MIFARGLTISVFVFLLTEPQVIAGGSECSGLETIYLSSTPNGSIHSPGYPYRYDNYENCQWRLIAPFGNKVLLYFTVFEVEDGSECGYDSVELFNGFDNSSPLLSKSCGSGLPLPVYSSSRYIYIRFKSDSSVTQKGFVAHYRKLTDSSDIFVSSSSSSSIASSPDIDGFYPTSNPYSTCTFQIDTSNGYILELSFTKMTISSCQGCSCGHVKVRDGTSSSSRLLGTFCSSNYHDVVTSNGNHMFVEYYASGRDDNFKATIRSKKALGVNVPAIVVPIVAAVFLFSIIFVVIKCTKIRTSVIAREIPLQPLPLGAEQPPTTQSPYSNTEFGMSHLPQPHAPAHPDPLTTTSHPLPSFADYSQGNTNISLAAETT